MGRLAVPSGHGRGDRRGDAALRAGRQHPRPSSAGGALQGLDPAADVRRPAQGPRRVRQRDEVRRGLAAPSTWRPRRGNRPPTAAWSACATWVGCSTSAFPATTTCCGYWDVVADRLFKIRNSLNLQGVFRQLPLFEPPIDPAMLARATAAGLSVDAIVGGLGQPPSHVRFAVLAPARSRGRAVRHLPRRCAARAHGEGGRRGPDAAPGAPRAPAVRAQRAGALRPAAGVGEVARGRRRLDAQRHHPLRLLRAAARPQHRGHQGARARRARRRGPDEVRPQGRGARAHPARRPDGHRHRRRGGGGRPDPVALRGGGAGQEHHGPDDHRPAQDRPAGRPGRLAHPGLRGQVPLLGTRRGLRLRRDAAGPGGPLRGRQPARRRRQAQLRGRRRRQGRRLLASRAGVGAAEQPDRRGDQPDLQAAARRPAARGDRPSASGATSSCRPSRPARSSSSSTPRGRTPRARPATRRCTRGRNARPAVSTRARSRSPRTRAQGARRRMQHELVLGATARRTSSPATRAARTGCSAGRTWCSTCSACGRRTTRPTSASWC